MNEEMIAYWNGPAAQRWTDQQAVLDRALAAYGQAVLEHASPRAGEHALDIGCGCGESAIALADRVGLSGSVLGIDISKPMLALARQRAEGFPNLNFQEADAATVTFDRKFELLFSRFGVMFFEDPIAAFRNLATAARSSARLSFVCWRTVKDNPWGTVPFNAVRPFVGEIVLPPDDAPGPSAFADATRVQRILTEAGFRDISIDRFDAPVVLGTGDLEEAVEFAVRGGPAARALVNAAPEVQERAREAVRRALEPMRTEAGFALPGSSWLVGARI